MSPSISINEDGRYLVWDDDKKVSLLKFANKTIVFVGYQP